MSTCGAIPDDAVAHDNNAIPINCVIGAGDTIDQGAVVHGINARSIIPADGAARNNTIVACGESAGPGGVRLPWAKTVESWELRVESSATAASVNLINVVFMVLRG